MKARVRLELAGNLCRCTGYAGIVRAIQRVLAEGVPARAARGGTAARAAGLAPARRPTARDSIRHADRNSFRRCAWRCRLPTVWRAIRDPYLVAACMPGARLIEVADDRLRGEVRASLGPIETLFSGEGRISFDDAEQRAEIVGDGRDSRTGTRLSARGVVRLQAAGRGDHRRDGDDRLYIARAARAVRAWCRRAGIRRGDRTDFAARLEARLTGKSLPEQRRLSAGSLILRAVWRRLRALLGFG